MVFPPNDKHRFTARYLGDFRTKYSGKFKGA